MIDRVMGIECIIYELFKGIDISTEKRKGREVDRLGKTD